MRMEAIQLAALASPRPSGERVAKPEALRRGEAGVRGAVLEQCSNRGIAPLTRRYAPTSPLRGEVSGLRAQPKFRASGGKHNQKPRRNDQ